MFDSQTRADCPNALHAAFPSKHYLDAESPEDRVRWDSGAQTDAFHRQAEAQLLRHPLLRALQPSPFCTPGDSMPPALQESQLPLSRVPSQPSSIGAQCRVNTAVEGAFQSAAAKVSPRMLLPGPRSTARQSFRQNSPSPGPETPVSRTPPPAEDTSAVDALVEVLSRPNQGATLAALLQLLTQLASDPQTAALLSEYLQSLPPQENKDVGPSCEVTAGACAQQSGYCAEKQLQLQQFGAAELPCSSTGSNNDIGAGDNDLSCAESAQRVTIVPRERLAKRMVFGQEEPTKKKLRFQ